MSHKCQHGSNTYTYDTNGNRAGLKYKDGQMGTSYVFNQANMLTTLNHFSGVESNVNSLGISNKLSDYTYAYRLDGNKVSETDSSKNTLKNYSYDDLGRLISESKQNNGQTPEALQTLLKPNESPDIVNDYSTAFTFDDYGNIQTKIQGAQTTTYAYDKNNRILTETTQNGEVTTTTKYTYDPNGNTIAEKRTVSAPVGSEAEKTLLKTGTPYVKLSYYNHLNQLVKVSTDKGVFKYGYNDKGLRISKTGPSGTMSYFWDGDKLIAEYKEGFGLKATYLYGVGGSQIHRKDALSGKIHYYFHNAHGDVTALTDGSGNVSTLYDYNSYGEVNVRGENIENPFKYFGQYYDEETGSYYLRARYYDPSMMRFTNEDTYQGKGEDPLSLNRYLYCTGNPVGYVDESGNVAIVPLLVYLGKTAVETIPDVLIDLLLDGGNFSAAKSFWGNFGLNVIPIAGEFQTVKKLGELATKYGDEIVQGLKNIDYITKNLDAIIEFVKKEDALGLASFIKGGSTTLKGAGKVNEYIAHNIDEIVANIININKKYSSGYQQNNSISSIVYSASYYENPYEQIASITRGVAQHAFVDGNKRTAFDTLNMLIKDLNLKVNLTDAQKWDLVSKMGKGEIKDVGEIAKILQGK